MAKGKFCNPDVNTFFFFFFFFFKSCRVFGFEKTAWTWGINYGKKITNLVEYQQHMEYKDDTQWTGQLTRVQVLRFNGEPEITFDVDNPNE